MAQTKMQVVQDEETQAYSLEYTLGDGRTGKMRLHPYPADVKAGLPDLLVEAGEAVTKGGK